jgi:hypothetical protein
VKKLTRIGQMNCRLELLSAIWKAFIDSEEINTYLRKDDRAVKLNYQFIYYQEGVQVGFVLCSITLPSNITKLLYEDVIKKYYKNQFRRYRRINAFACNPQRRENRSGIIFCLAEYADGEIQR